MTDNPAHICAEPTYYLNPEAPGYVAILIDGRQRSFPVSELPAVLAEIPANSDACVSQATFCKPTRRTVHLESVGLCFADLDTYKSAYSHLSPDQQAYALRLHCEETGLPQPSLVNASGLGLHAKWLFDASLPAEDLPQWNAVQQGIVKQLEPFGVDRAARDVSRCLRMVGTINPKYNQAVRTLWRNESETGIVRYDFDLLQAEIVPQEIVAAAVCAEEVSSSRRPGKSNLWSARELWWQRLQDMKRLVVLRRWFRGIPEGYRNNFLFMGACAVVWNTPSDRREEEVKALAREWCPSFSPSAIRSCTGTALSKAREKEAYRYTNERVIEMLEITTAEQKHLKTLIDAEERKERDRLRHRKSCDRATYLEEAADRRERAMNLKSIGLKPIQIAEAMNISINSAYSLLRQGQQLVLPPCPPSPALHTWEDMTETIKRYRNNEVRG